MADQLPRKGSAARKVYDCVAASPDGLTVEEIERRCGPLKSLQLRLNEMRSKGTLQLEGVTWKAKKASSEAPAQKKTPKPGRFPSQKLDPCECPACGATVFQLLQDVRHGGQCVYVNTRRRLVVFDGPWSRFKHTDPETGKKVTTKLPKEPLCLLEEWTGKPVTGREATDDERAYYAEHKKLKVPFTIGFETHLTTCSGWKRWLSGRADEKRRTWTMKWDKGKKRNSFVRPDSEPRKSMMEETNPNQDQD